MIKTSQYLWKDNQWKKENESVKSPQICLVFASRLRLEQDGKNAINLLKQKFPNTKIITTSSAGNIIDVNVEFDAIVATFIEFEKTELKINSFDITDNCDIKLGKTIANSFDTKNLKLVLLFTTANLNAGNLIEGINSAFDHKILVSGGMAGDGIRFDKTLVGIDQGYKEDSIVAIGLYGEDLDVSHGSKGGWKPFGPPRLVTRAKDNILYEIDNKPVLDIYKDYLGPKAKDLPVSALLFPFAIIDKETNELVIRGVQTVDQTEKSITLYGNVTEGQTVRLMRANHSVLIDGAGESASDSLLKTSQHPQLAILVSCVARRLALDQLIEDEIEEVRSTYGNDTTLCGFYSYSEFSPLAGSNTCNLHNQTMTITALSEN